MIKKAKIVMMGLLVAPLIALSAGAMSMPASAQSDGMNLNSGVSATQGEGVPEALDGDDGVVTKAVNILLFIIGILSVIMIIFSGIKYATSSGAPDKVKSAKDTLMYSVVGLIIALFAFAIVNFVLKGVGVNQ